MRICIHPTFKAGISEGRTDLVTDSPERPLRGAVILAEEPLTEPFDKKPRQHSSVFSALAMCGAISLIAFSFTSYTLSYFEERQDIENLYAASILNLDSDDSLYKSAGRQSFLGGLRSQDAYKKQSQVNFLSSLIRGQLNHHPEYESIAKLIVSESIRANYDPLFVAAVVRSESMFKRGAVSHVGARGLMQIMPETGAFLARRAKINLSQSDLHDPKVNLQLGIAYLKYLEEMFKGNRTKALIAYNWGPGNLLGALKRRVSPPSSTVKYAHKIISTHSKWQNQYLQVASNAKDLTLG